MLTVIVEFVLMNSYEMNKYEIDTKLLTSYKKPIDIHPPLSNSQAQNVQCRSVTCICFVEMK